MALFFWGGKIKKTYHVDQPNKLVGFYERIELEGLLKFLMMLIFECMFVELFYKSTNYFIINF